MKNYKVIVEVPEKGAKIFFNVAANTEEDAIVVVNKLCGREQGLVLYCEVTAEEVEVE